MRSPPVIKNSIFVVYILLMLGAESSLAQANPPDGLSVDVSSTSSVSHLWVRSNPAKLFQCWGGPEQAEANNDNSKTGTSNQNSGTLSDSFRGLKTGFDPYSPQKVNWNDTLSENRDLVLEFNQDVTPAQRTYIHHLCDTQRFDSRLDGLTNRMAAHVRLTIPQGVRILRVRQNAELTTLLSKQRVKTAITNVATITKDALDSSEEPYSAAGNNVHFNLGEYEYFFVRPTDQIDFSVDWSNSEIRSGKIKLGYDIRLIGYDGCGKYMDPDQPGVINSKAFSFEAAQKDPNDFIERIACLRSPEYLSSILYNNHGRSLMSELAAISNTAGQINSAGQMPFHDELSIATTMTTYDIAFRLLKDLSTYCDSVKVRDLFGLAPKSGVQVRGYYYVARAYARVKFLLALVRTDLMTTFVGTVQSYQQRGLTYQTALQSSKDLQVMKVMAGDLTDSDFEVYDDVRKALDVVPATDLGKSKRAQLLIGLKVAQDAAIDLRSEVQTMIGRLSTRQNQPVQADSLTSALGRFNQANDSVQNDLRDDVGWFMDNSTSYAQSDFFKNMEALNNDILAQATGVLQNFTKRLSASNVNDDFLRTEQVNALVRSTNICLAGSVK
jgi:hypothetical protein